MDDITINCYKNNNYIIWPNHSTFPDTSIHQRASFLITYLEGANLFNSYNSIEWQITEYLGRDRRVRFRHVALVLRGLLRCPRGHVDAAAIAASAEQPP